MNSEKIVQMVRDYLYLAPFFAHKKHYLNTIKLAGNVLTDAIYESDDEESSTSEFEITRDMKLLYKEYLWFVTLKLAEYLDRVVEPYTCPGTGSTYRHYYIKHEQEPLVIVYQGSELTEEDVNNYIKEFSCYPIKIILERKDHVIGGEDWKPYHD